MYYLPILLDRKEFKRIIYNHGLAGEATIALFEGEDLKAKEGKEESFIKLNTFLHTVGKEQLNVNSISNQSNRKCVKNNKSCIKHKRKFCNCIENNKNKNYLKLQKKKMFKIKKSNLGIENKSESIDDFIDKTVLELTKQTERGVLDLPKDTISIPNIKTMSHTGFDSNIPVVELNKTITDNGLVEEYIPYKEKYIKIILAEAISMIGTVVLALVCWTSFSRKYILIILTLIVFCCALGKVIALQYVEYFVAVMRFATKSGLITTKLFSCENFHTDYRETVFVFFGFFGRFFYFFAAFIADALMETGIYSINYYEIALSFTFLVILLFLKTDDPNKPVDNVRDISNILSEYNKDRSEVEKSL